MKTIIDVSKWQGSINWDEVKAAGIDGAIIRCGYGKNEFKNDDVEFYNNVKGAQDAGVPIGIYLYSYAADISEVEDEAQHALRLASGLNLALPIFYDIEESGTESGANDRANKFVEIVNAAGYAVGIYANEYWYKTHLTNVDASAWRWVAKYGTNDGTAQTMPAIDNVAIWQYTSKGEVNGINGNVDMNYLYKDFIAADKKTNDEIADEVIKGIWGNGQERINRLNAAGYDANTIQNIVNEKLNVVPDLKKSNDEIADEVIKGLWGNGQERIDRLTAAGYDANAIQSIVNSKLVVAAVRKTNEEIANEIIKGVGDWGNGQERINKLVAAGYDANAVQSIINNKLK